MMKGTTSTRLVLSAILVSLAWMGIALTHLSALLHLSNTHGGEYADVVHKEEDPRHHDDASHSTLAAAVAVLTTSRPTAILHMGPRKTATTTIQAWIRALSKEYLLPHDNLVFRGRTESGYGEGASRYFRKMGPPPSLATRMYPKQHANATSTIITSSINDSNAPAASMVHTSAEDDNDQTFLEWAHQIHKDATVHQRHVLFSDEGIPRLQNKYRAYVQKRKKQQQLSLLQNDTTTNTTTEIHSVLHLLRDYVFRDYRGNIQVHATYRRYFDWIYSEYQEQMVHRTMTEGARRPVLGFVEWYRLVLEIGSNHTNHVVPPQEKESKQYRTLMKYYYTVRPLVRSDIDEWKEVFNTTVRVFNMHAPKKTTATNASLPLPLRWLCEMLPDIAQFTCGQINSGQLEMKTVPERKRSSDPYYRAKRIAWHAVVPFKKHMFFAPSTEIQEDGILKDIQDHLDKSSDVPMICLSEKEFQEMYAKSVAIQSEVVPDYHNDGPGKQDMQVAWDRILASKMFCDVDIEKIFEQQSWKDLLTSIANKIAQDKYTSSSSSEAVS